MVGAWGEGSEDLHDSIKDTADSRMKFVGLARERPVSDGNLAVLLVVIYRYFYPILIYTDIDTDLSVSVRKIIKYHIGYRYQ